MRLWALCGRFAWCSPVVCVLLLLLGTCVVVPAWPDQTHADPRRRCRTSRMCTATPMQQQQLHPLQSGLAVLFFCWPCGMPRGLLTL